MPGLVPGIHVFLFGQENKTWMAGTSPAMTMWLGQHSTPFDYIVPRMVSAKVRLGPGTNQLLYAAAA